MFTNFRVASMVESSNPYGVLDSVAIGVTDGVVQWIEPVASLPGFDDTVEIIDGNNQWLTPGLIDCHTHLVYAVSYTHLTLPTKA